MGILSWTSAAQAGMPSITLTDLAALRLQAISFFLLLLLVSAGFIKFIWNRLARDWTFLPRLSFAKAIGVVILWGFLFVLVLTMISGARELMTPGAWEKDGFTYKLAKDKAAEPGEESLEVTRRRKIDSLRLALWDYADKHHGQFPTGPESREAVTELWQCPDSSHMPYGYVLGLDLSKKRRILAYEPDFFGPTRLILTTDGDIKSMSNAELTQALGGGKP
jgi:hypothetical protein